MLNNVSISLLAMVCYITGSSDDLIALLEETISVNDWYALGMVLGLERYQLEDIKINHMTEIDCRRKMISQWMHTGDASWRALVRALASPLVLNMGLAKRIAAKHTKCEEHVRYTVHVHSVIIPSTC